MLISKQDCSISRVGMTALSEYSSHYSTIRVPQSLYTDFMSGSFLRIILVTNKFIALHTNKITVFIIIIINCY